MDHLKKEIDILGIEEDAVVTIDYFTMKYKKLAKEKHPDKAGGNTEDFQVLQGAYRRVIHYLEGLLKDEPYEDFEKDFFMKNNLTKECSTSFVIYIQDTLVDGWKHVFGRHLITHKSEKGRVIFKTGAITITLYDKPKKDPRSKIHIQSRSQEINLEFVMDKLPAFYKEVFSYKDGKLTATKVKWMQKATCGQCGKQFTNKKGVKQHVLR